MRRRWDKLILAAYMLALGMIVMTSGLILGLGGEALAQEVEKKAESVEEAAADTPATDEKKADEEPEEEAPAAPMADVNPRLVVLHLQDGSILTGEMGVDEISVATDFGTLKVPLAKIRSISPGLGSSPELSETVNGMIEGLGSEDYKVREQSHKDLVAYGLRVRKLLEKHKGDENAERKRHVTEILKELEELATEQEEFGEEAAVQPWIEEDTVVTTEFTIVGKVSPDEFKVDSRYGELTVQLADLRRAERPSGTKESIRKLVTVAGDNLVQRSFKSSGIKVSAGDKISVKADGSVIMTPWGSDSAVGPDGAPNYGWFVPNQIAGGALVAKIGDKGQVFKVGSKSTFVAKQSGTLQFAVAVQAQYANQGYSYPGNYNVRVTVEPK